MQGVTAAAAPRAAVFSAGSSVQLAAVRGCRCARRGHARCFAAAPATRRAQRAASATCAIRGRSYRREIGAPPSAPRCRPCRQAACCSRAPLCAGVTIWDRCGSRPPVCLQRSETWGSMCGLQQAAGFVPSPGALTSLVQCVHSDPARWPPPSSGGHGTCHMGQTRQSRGPSGCKPELLHAENAVP